MELIIIVGGGATGLMAAIELSLNNHVIILEGGGRLGGRIHTVVDGGFSQPIEAGAEFIHGNLPLTLQLLNEAGIKITETRGEMFSYKNGKWVDTDTIPAEWGGMMQKMMQLTEDITLEDFLLKNYGGEKYAELCEQARGYAQGYDVADPEKVSVFFLRDEWTAGWDDQYRVDGGYSKLIAFMAAKCVKNKVEIHTNATVNSIQWAKNKVTALTVAGRQYGADRIIVTVPVGVMQNTHTQNYINFTPAIHSKINALQNIGYGGVIKIVFEFKAPFWEEQKLGLGFLFCDGFIPTWWTQAPNNVPIITGWLGGPKADALAGEDEATLLVKCLQTLAVVFGRDINKLKYELVASKVFNWPANQFSLGAYSYATPFTKEAIKILQAPIDDTIYFAGEALYNGAHPGTVEAALVSGKGVANKILHA